MLVEAAAQASSGIIEDDVKTVQMGFLVTLKNIKLLKEPKSMKYIVNIHLEYKLENFKSFSFSVIDETNVIATGVFSVALQ